MKLSLTILLTFCLALLSNAHNVLLPSYGRRCFFEKLKKGDELAISFQFGDRNPEGNHQLKGDLIIYGNDRKEVLKAIRDISHGDEVLTVPQTGKYEYCFLNENFNINTKDVTFNVHGTKFIDLDDPENDSIDAALRKLTKLVNEVDNEQQYIVIRERTHRNTAESTNDRVKWWSIFQLGVVVANSLFQIFYLKRFFEVTSFV